MAMAKSSTLTFLFTDLVQSTQHLTRAGEERGHRLFSTHHKLTSQTVAANGGEELEWLGDGILAAFSSASDAVRCAIRIQQIARRPAAGVRFDIRIGIHVGEAIRREGGYFGTSVVTTRRLCDLAQPGQILCSKVIQDLLATRRGFDFRELGDQALKGLSAPVTTVEVVYERNDAAALLNRTPFVGREAQFKRLSDKLNEAGSGNGAVAMLVGEAGIGKTRTLEEFSDLAVAQGMVVLRGACYEGEWQRPYGPFAEVVLDYAKKAQPNELKVFDRNAPILVRIAPGLGDRLGSIPEPIALEKEDERFRLFDAVSQLLIDISRQRPLLMVFDDLHWADRGTVAMLGHVAHFVPGNAILLVGAYRDAEVDRNHPLTNVLASMRRAQNFESVKLAGLSGDELGALLETIGDQNAPAALVKALGDATEGNPLFIREVLLYLLEEGKILRAGQGWISRLGIDELRIPEGIRELVDRRLTKLSGEANQFLAVGSAFNGAFSFNVASAVAGLDEDAALGAADEGLQSQLLCPGGDSDTLDFTHALIRRALYEALNPARRVRLHRRIAEQMERTWGVRAVEHAAEVAYQFWRGAAGASGVRGAEYAIAAADNAEAAFDHDEVATFLRIALNLISDGDQRRAALLGRLSFALAWSLNAGEALAAAQQAGALITATGGSIAAADFYERIARALFTAGLTRPAWELARAGLGYIGTRRDIVWASLAEIDINRAEAENPENPGIMLDSDQSRALGEVLRRLPHQELDNRNIEPFHLTRDEILGDSAPLPRVFMRSGDYRSSRTRWQAEAGDCERRGALARAVRAWAGVGRCHNALGEFDAAQAAFDRAGGILARMPGATFGAMALQGARFEYHLAIDDEWGEFERRLRDEVCGGSDAPLMHVIGALGAHNKWMVSGAHCFAAYMYACVNQPDLAVQHLNELPAAIARGAQWSANYVMTACLAVGTIWTLDRSDHAELMERSIIKKIVEPNLHYPMNDGRLSLARLCALQRRYDEAKEWFEKARQMLDEQGARPLRAITDFDEGLMYLRRAAPGDEQMAAPHLDAAYQQFRAAEMTGWIRRIDRIRSPATN